MNYSPDIADRYDFTVNQFESKKKWLEEIQQIMNERADVELAYSKSLIKVANLCEKYSQKNNLEKGLASIVMSVRSVILTQSEQSQQYGQQLKTDVINTLKNGIKKQQDDLKTLQQKVIFLKNELNRNIADLERQKQEYYKNFKYMMKSKEQVLSLQLQETNPLMIVLQENERLLLQNQKIVEDGVMKYNVFLDQYFTEIAQANKVQDMMEDFRIEVVKDSLLKVLVYQISAMKNVEYDTNQVSKKIENYEREDPKPIYIEQQERMMLSKLNFLNYIQYVQTECSYPQIDKMIQKAESSTLEQTSYQNINTLPSNFMERNLQQSFQEMRIKEGIVLQLLFINFLCNMKYSGNQQRFEEIYRSFWNQIQYRLKFSNKEQWLIELGIQQIVRKQLIIGRNILQFNILGKQQHQKGFHFIFSLYSIKSYYILFQFKDIIDSSEREIILFTLALNEFSTQDTVVKENFHQKSISDLIFLLCHVFDKIEQTKESDLIERCLNSFFKICKTYVREEEQKKIYIESLQQHRILSTKDFWVQDTSKKINQAIQRDYGKLQISRARQAEFQLKQDIPKWKVMQFPQELSISILNEIASSYRLEEEKRQFYENVILEKEKIPKKPIFSNDSRPNHKKEQIIQKEQDNVQEQSENDKQKE